eukprot:UN04888
MLSVSGMCGMSMLDRFMMKVLMVVSFILVVIVMMSSLCMIMEMFTFTISRTMLGRIFYYDAMNSCYGWKIFLL